jgi:hypothetical protein
MRTYDEAVARARELTAGDGRERYVWWNYSRDNPGEYKYSAKQPTRRKDRSHAIIMADGSIDVGFGYGAPRNYGMRPMSLSARELMDAPGRYLGAIQMTFPECQSNLLEAANFIRAEGMAEVVRQKGLMQSVYGLASCINRNA